MNHSTVIFDLGGTLIDNWDFIGYAQCIRRIADVLGLGEEFAGKWMDADTSVRTLVGEFSGFGPQVEYCAGVPINSLPADLITKAEELHIEFSLRNLAPRKGAIPLLEELKSSGYRIGLLSDCGWDIPQLWHSTPFPPYFDYAVFSCKAMLRKPDPKFFQYACDRLGVQPEECVYVADGNSFELTGAKKLGMYPVLICMPYEREAVMQRDDPRSWQGPVIQDPLELIKLLR